VAYFTTLGGRDTPELIGVIKSTGYGAALPEPPEHSGARPDPVARDLARWLAGCAPLAAVVIVLAMVPAFQFPGWQWESLLFAAPVVGWGALPLHRAALAGLGHGAATMDTGQPRGHRIVLLVAVRSADRRRGQGRHADAVHVHLHRGKRADPLP
jgi:cation transport ATPase